MSKIKAKHSANTWFEKIFTWPYQIIFFVCILLYVQILSFGLVHFDDHGFVLMASDTLSISNISQFFRHSVFWVLGDTTQETDVFYRPLQNVVYAICNTIATKQAWIHHFIGLFFHIIISCVLFRFFKEIKYHSTISLLLTLIYSVHPVLVQGVAWIAGIGDQLAALFSLLSIIYFIKMVGLSRKEGSGHVFLRLKYVFSHLFFLACALFSKEISIVLILLCLFWFFFHPNLEGDKISAAKLSFSFVRDGVTVIGWMIVIAIYFIFRNNAIHSPKISLFTFVFESFKVNMPLVFEYLEKIFLPYRLSPIPSREDAQFTAGLIIFAILIFLIIYKKKFTRMCAFGIIWFVVFLFPTFIQQNPQAHFFAFEHRLYLPLIGIVIVMMELINIKRINFQSDFQKYAFGLVFFACFSMTFSYSRTFTDPYMFYDRAISFSPKSVIAYNGFGKFLLEDKKYAAAIDAFKKSYEYKSDDLQTTGKIAEIYLKNLNNPIEAIVWFKKTLSIAPNSVEAAVSIGDAYFNFLHDTASAITWYTNALKIDPQNEFSSSNLGVIYASKGKNNEARSFFLQSLKSNPKNLLSLKWMAISYFNKGEISEAVIYLNKAFEYYHDDIDLQRNLMICYYKLNDFANTEKFATIYSKKNNQIPAEIEVYLKSGKH